jgi:hypothetical protein
MSQGFILLLIEKPNVNKTSRFPFQERSGHFTPASRTRTTSGFQGLWFSGYRSLEGCPSQFFKASYLQLKNITQQIEKQG